MAKKAKADRYVCRHRIETKTPEGARKVFPPGAEITAADIQGGQKAIDRLLESKKRRPSALMPLEDFEEAKRKGYSLHTAASN